jgi:hypothetical protein
VFSRFGVTEVLDSLIVFLQSDEGVQTASTDGVIPGSIALVER